MAGLNRHCFTANSADPRNTVAPSTAFAEITLPVVSTTIATRTVPVTFILSPTLGKSVAPWLQAAQELRSSCGSPQEPPASQHWIRDWGAKEAGQAAVRTGGLECPEWLPAAHLDGAAWGRAFFEVLQRFERWTAKRLSLQSRGGSCGLRVPTPQRQGVFHDCGVWICCNRFRRSRLSLRNLAVEGVVSVEGEGSTSPGERWTEGSSEGCCEIREPALPIHVPTASTRMIATEPTSSFCRCQSIQRPPAQN